MSAGKGLFVSFEGGEGSGKTTQIRLLAEKLQNTGLEVVKTREPGGTPEAEKIRPLLAQRDGGAWTPMAECLLLFAARTMHADTLIKPALAAGKIVLSDRFTDSTRAYQSHGHGLPIETVERLNRLVLDGFAPDLTIILDIPVEEGLNRAGERLNRDGSAEDRFERLDISFHERLRHGYLEIARREPQRCRVIDAAQAAETIADQIETEVRRRLNDV
jgi:dTMP kinase